MFLGGEGDFSAVEHIPIEISEIHPKYNPNSFAYDFWLIKLQWPSQLYADQAIGLDSSTDDFDLMANEELITMGFGQAATGELYPPNVLQETTLRYISNADCIAPKTKYPSTMIFDSVLCLKSDGVMNACRVNMMIIRVALCSVSSRLSDSICTFIPLKFLQGQLGCTSHSCCSKSGAEACRRSLLELVS